MGYIVVAGVHTADKALEEFISADVVRRCVYETSLIGNVIGELALLLYAHNVAVAVCDCTADKLHQLFGLAGTLQPHDDLNQVDHAPFLCW